jgi:multicomponent Na+:H+ antiporter subunit G
VIGIIRMPDIYTKLHAASKSVFLGVCSFLIAAATMGDPAYVARVVLIGLLLILTTPVAAYEIARAAAREQFSPADLGDEGVARPGAAGNGRVMEL